MRLCRAQLHDKDLPGGIMSNGQCRPCKMTARKVYDTSERGRAAHSRYEKSDKGRNKQARYRATEGKRAADARYYGTAKGQLAAMRRNAAERCS